MVASPRSIGLHVSIWPPRRPVNFQLNPIHGTGNQRGLVRLGFCKFPTEGNPWGPTTNISSSLTTRAGPIGFQVTQRQTQRNPEWQRQLLFVPTYQDVSNCCRTICEPILILSSVILRDFHFAVSTFHVKSTLNWDITQFVGFLLKQHLDAFSKDKSHAILKLVECIN